MDTAGAIDEQDIADLLVRLVAKSLIVFDESTGRYRCLETVRQYAREQLIANLDAGGQDPRRKHAAFFYQLMTSLNEPSSSASLARVEADYENVRQALDWWSQQPEDDNVLQMAIALYSYWFARGLLHEASDRFQTILQSRIDKAKHAYGRALFCLADVNLHLGNVEEGKRAFEETLSIAKQTQNTRLMSLAFSGLAGLHQDHVVDFELSRSYRLQALELSKSFPDADSHVARHLYNLGDLTMKHHPDLQGARRHEVFLEAKSYFEKALELSKQHGDSRVTFFLYAGLGGAALNLGDLSSAKSHALQGLRYCIDSGNTLGQAVSLALLAHCAVEAKAFDAGATLFGRSVKIVEQTGFVPGVHEQAMAQQALDACRHNLGEAAFDQAVERGRTMSIEQLYDLADKGIVV